MTPIYIGYEFKVTPLQPAVEIIIAELGELGFESFVETETGVNAYIQKEFWNEDILNDVFILSSDEFSISFSFQEIEQVNWNTEWEKNFNPIVVDDQCAVRAPFHEPINVPFEIVIEPKMSFGTGHHATTHMMMQYILELDVQNKKTLDMGCGTGVLAILAEMNKAQPIDAIDIDNWCYINSVENIERNQCVHIQVLEGDAGLLAGKNYDFIIANINRNILINDMSVYASCLNTNGDLLLSGFYEKDLEIIKESCLSNGLEFVSNKIKDKWISAYFRKLN